MPVAESAAQLASSDLDGQPALAEPCYPRPWKPLKKLRPSPSKSPAEIAELIENGAQLIDVRQDYEFDAAHLAGARPDRPRDPRRRPRRASTGRAGHLLLPHRQPVRHGRPGFRGGRLRRRTRCTGGITAWIEEGKEIEPADGYVAEPGEAAAILRPGQFELRLVRAPEPAKLFCVNWDVLTP